ncbi:hypothetical protein N7462_001170 [Penicillium macrosclerotiorum]|uniref:uncharacterized protein n=1 Tax=Penicillium macrosclerotiorum TaxID=303699 RepID=UPI002547D341|nr:uncharacterized protein N7462_001170 [Penicillium macrosclerotiorum]KAJ5691747.1 hypothetical protein N7462_001170 [Penicillium macrosclerotiorum]
MGNCSSSHCHPQRPQSAVSDAEPTRSLPTLHHDSAGTARGPPVGAYSPQAQVDRLGPPVHVQPGPSNPKEHTVIALTLIGTMSFDNGSVARDSWNALIFNFGIKVNLGFRFLFLLALRPSPWTESATCRRFLWTQPTASGLVVCPSARELLEDQPDGLLLGCARGHHDLPVHSALSLHGSGTIRLDHLVRPKPHRMDLLPTTLDWNTITGYNDPQLVVPSYAFVNVLIGIDYDVALCSHALQYCRECSVFFIAAARLNPYDFSKPCANIANCYMDLQWARADMNNSAIYRAFNTPPGATFHSEDMALFAKFVASGDVGREFMDSVSYLLNNI